MLPSNILMVLAPLLGLTQAAALHPKSFVTVHLYGDYDKHYVEKVWPDGDEHWFSKSSHHILFPLETFYRRVSNPMFYLLMYSHNRRGRGQVEEGL